MTKQSYAGIDKDNDAGLTPLGRIVRDAWVFEILPESETCAGWDMSRMQNLYERVYAAWEPYAHLPSRLPDTLKKRHAKLYAEAIQTARNNGWDTELGEDG